VGLIVAGAFAADLARHFGELRVRGAALGALVVAILTLAWAPAIGATMAAAAIIVAQKVNQACGGNNCGLTIDYGHQKMEATTASTACDLAAFAGVPVHKFDVNDARQGRNDQDLMFGTISIPESVEYLYTTFLRNYQGWYSQDQFTYREDPTRAIERSMINFANLSLKAVRVIAQQPALDKARAAGTGPDVLDVVSPILVG